MNASPPQGSDAGGGEASGVLIIGAGMAGLTAARRLAEFGIPSTIVDKGRRPGGRMATRTIDGARFDHGAQHFSARSDALSGAVDTWTAAGVATVWLSSPSITNPDLGVESRYVGTNGMRGIPEFLAAGLDLRLATPVDRLERTASGVAAFSGPENVGEGSGVIVTPPVPQTLALLRAGDVIPPPEVESMLADVSYDATLAVMAQLDGPAGLPDGHLSPPGQPIAWLADNQRKGVSPLPAVTIHSTPEFAAERLNADRNRWVPLLCDHASRYLGADITSATGHRWRYSRPQTTLKTAAVGFRSPAPIVLAGEVFAGARVEGAFLSGLAAAATMRSML
jgi:predicted NAD/FAD-dependent oxidoreductase